VIDTANDPMETRAITVGISPRAVAFTPNGQHAYVLDVVVDAGRSTGNVSVIETATKKVVAEVRVATPLEVAVNPHGKHAYVIDTAHNTVVSPTILNDSPRTFWNHAWISKNCDNTYDRDPGNDQFYARYSSVAPFGQKGTVDLRV
jgi:hypothetical protein